MKTKESGITLTVLVITIILILILASIGTTVGTEAMEFAKFTQFKAELKIIQNKVNELNQENKTDIEQELKDVPGLTEEQKNILNITEITNIIFDGENNEEIQSGFRYFTKDDINTIFNLDSVKRDYFINVEYRYVIFPDGFEYKGTKYYMIDQIDGEIYNVRYHNKNTGNGSFKVNVTNEKNKSKIEITNIDYPGYVDKWQVKYRLDDNSYWETSDDLTFYIKKEGTYTVKVIHGDEINLGEQEIIVLFDETIPENTENI